ncbi:MAG: hypothetical protein COA62_00675 [Rhodobiaceae bacterium]|nr:MAG: hypothetical protein COA62_00675 [Rhodobiaceae bacterium]
MADLLDFGVPALLSTLPEDLAHALNEAAVAVRYTDGQLIHARGDAEQSLSIVKSGAVRLGQVTYDGTYTAIAVLGPGQFFGEFTIFAGLPREFDANASGPTIINEVSRQRFDRLIERHRGIREHFLFSLARRLHAVLEFVDDMRRLSLPVRTAKTLLMMVRAEGTAEPLKMTQSELAEMLGVTRVSANKALAHLEQAGLIVRAYGQIHVVDMGGMATWIATQTRPDI